MFPFIREVRVEKLLPLQNDINWTKKKEKKPLIFWLVKNCHSHIAPYELQILGAAWECYSLERLSLTHYKCMNINFARFFCVKICWRRPNRAEHKSRLAEARWRGQPDRYWKFSGSSTGSEVTSPPESVGGGHRSKAMVASAYIAFLPRFDPARTII